MRSSDSESRSSPCQRLPNAREGGDPASRNLVAMKGRIVPIEVKSGPAGKLRSLHLLLREYPQCSPGLVLSEAPFAELPEQGLVFVPLYYAGSLDRIIGDS